LGGTPARELDDYVAMEKLDPLLTAEQRTELRDMLEAAYCGMKKGKKQK
jgi:hypothetical protein